jgi:hypothetical protein
MAVPNGCRVGACHGDRGKADEGAYSIRVVSDGRHLLAGAAAAQNGVILDQAFYGSKQGYTVIRVWGTHYEMGQAQAHFLGGHIVDAVSETEALLGLVPVLIWLFRRRDL